MSNPVIIFEDETKVKPKKEKLSILDHLQGYLKHYFENCANVEFQIRHVSATFMKIIEPLLELSRLEYELNNMKRLDANNIEFWPKKRIYIEKRRELISFYTSSLKEK